MTAYAGMHMQLYIDDGASEPINYIAIAGAQSKTLRLRRNLLRNDNAASTSWMQRSEEGACEMSIELEGVFFDDAAAQHLLQAVLQRQHRFYQLVFANGDVLQGVFAVAEYERDGTQEQPERFRLRLLSAGEIDYSTG